MWSRQSAPHAVIHGSGLRGCDSTPDCSNKRGNPRPGFFPLSRREDRGFSRTEIPRFRTQFLLTTLFVNGTVLFMVDLCVIDDPASASVALDPVRSRLLAELRSPASAATLASRVGLAQPEGELPLANAGSSRAGPRRKRKTLGRADRAATGRDGVRRTSSRPRRSVPSRRIPNARSTDATWTGSPRAISRRWPPADCPRARPTAPQGRGVGQALATLSIDTEVRFPVPEDRAAFTSELTAAVTRWFRVITTNPHRAGDGID